MLSYQGQAKASLPLSFGSNQECTVIVNDHLNIYQSLILDTDTLIPSHALDNVHKHPITLLLVDDNIISCSKDLIYNNTTSQTMAQDLGYIQCGSIKKDALIVSSDKDIHLICRKTLKRVLFQGHFGTVTCTSFCKDDWFISCSEDRTFKVWDMKKLELVFQSHIVSSSPFTTLSIDNNKHFMSLGSEDGLLRIYDLNSRGILDCEPRLMQTLDMAKHEHLFVRKIIKQEQKDTVVSSLPKWKLGSQTEGREEKIVESSRCILHLQHLNHAGSQRLFVGFASGFLLLDTNNYEMLYSHCFAVDQVQLEGSDRSFYLQNASLYHLSAIKDLSNCYTLLTGNKMTGVIHVLRMHFNRKKKQIQIPDCSLLETVQLLVHHHVPNTKWQANVVQDIIKILESHQIFVWSDLDQIQDIPEQLPSYMIKYLQSRKSFEHAFSKLSLLHSEPLSFLKSPTKKPVTPKRKIQTVQAGRVGAKDMPVTFRPSVKSSGYTQPPAVTKLFTRPGSKPKPKPVKSIAEGHASYDDIENMVLQQQVHQSTVQSVRYNYSGTLIASCSTDRSCRYSKTNLTIQGDFQHDSSVHNVSWGLNPVKTYGQILLTSSRDTKPRLWCTERAEPILEFSGSPKFEREIKLASLYYQDKFIVIPYQDQMMIYSYELEPLQTKSVRPMLNYNKYKLVKTIHGSGNQITSLGLLNAHKSHMVFLGSSDKSLQIWDLNTQSISRMIDNCHTRPVTDIQLQDYQYFSQPSGQLFVTGAVTDSIKVWDLRQKDCVAHLHGHINRHATIKSRISPCGTLVAVGSEDHHCYLYDLRMNMVQKKIKHNHLDVVSCVDFHPTKPELVTGGYDGKLRRFQ
ncbi:WD40-repeat-containing domain protein [Gorgonomyces haynaldii]|nr:WD40-repeat-containing domain protein [Gorgonomyces haynaldii]